MAASDAVSKDAETLVVGRISGVFGVRGWLKVYSHTQPRENILDYSPWLLRANGSWREYRPAEGKIHGKALVVRLKGCDDRDVAAELVGQDVAIRRDQLPAAGPDEYYWSDLEGLVVRTLDNVELGEISHLFETGANDVIVVKGDKERLIPFVWEQVIREVDLEAGVMLVDWDPDF